MELRTGPEVSRERGEEAARLSRQMKAMHRYVSSQMMGAMQEQLQDDDLSFSQMSALHQLRTYAPMSVGGLAERTGLSLPAASHLTDRLVVRGYANRRENPEDRRAKLLELSDLGQKVLESMDRRFTDGYRVAFERVDPQVIRAAADAVEALLRELQVAGPGECSAAPIQPLRGTPPAPGQTAEAPAVAGRVPESSVVLSLVLPVSTLKPAHATPMSPVDAGQVDASPDPSGSGLFESAHSTPRRSKKEPV